MDSCPVPLILGVDWIIRAEMTIEGVEGRLVVRRRRKCCCVEQPCSPVVAPLTSPGETQEDAEAPDDQWLREIEPTGPADIDGDSQEFSLRTVSRFEAPAGSMALAEARVGFPEGSLVMIGLAVSYEQGREWVIPRAAVTVKGGIVRVPIVNLSDRPLKWAAGAMLAGAEACQEESVDSMGLKGEIPANLNSDIQLGSKLSAEERAAVIDVLAASPGCFKGLGGTDAASHSIDTGDAGPIRSRPYRYSASERGTISTLVQEMVDAGVAAPSDSPWSSPVVLVRKKNGEHRFCVDYRRLNATTKKDVYPLPRMDDALDRLGGAQFFSTIDLASGYWQVGVDPASQEKTAFITPDGLFEFQRMPFGLCNAPATFQRLMDRVLGSLKWTHCLVYLDDILVFGRTLEEHNSRLASVLERLQKAGLTVNIAKCRFAAESVSFLGHEVGADGLRPNPEKVRAVAEFSPPTSVTQLRSFLGLVSFYRRFIPGFSTRALPLTRLLKKAAKWRWGEEEAGAFDNLRNALATAPVLAPFHDDLPVEMFTDASGVGLGAVLMQPHEEGLRPVAYVSRRLVGAEERYHSNEQEILAVVWALGKLRPYVYGRRVTVHTDNNVVRWLYSKKEISGRLSRWVLPEPRQLEFNTKLII